MKPLRLRNTNHLNTLPRIKISPLSSSLALSRHPEQRHPGPDPGSHSYPVMLNLIQHLSSSCTAASQYAARLLRHTCGGLWEKALLGVPLPSTSIPPPTSSFRTRSGISTRLFSFILRNPTQQTPPSNTTGPGYQLPSTTQQTSPVMPDPIRHLSIPVPLTKPLVTPTH